jgi:hypothetical protein
MTELQIQIIDLLKSNNCNVSESIEGICSLDDYFSFLKDSDFAAGVAEAKQKRDDVVLSALMELVAAGDKTAITDYQRMKRQDGDANDAKRIRKEFMRLAVELAETKGRCLKEYCGVFNASNKASEKAYADVVAEYNLTTPYERAKMAQEIHKESSSALFDAGNLSCVPAPSDGSIITRGIIDISTSHSGDRTTHQLRNCATITAMTF